MPLLRGIHLARVVIAAALIAAGPFLDLKLLRQLRKTPEAHLRLQYYRYGVTGLSVTGILCFALIGFRGLLHLPRSVVAPSSGTAWHIPLPMLMGITAGALLGLLVPGLLCLFVKKMQQTYTKAFAKNDLVYLFPIGPQQRRWWAALSLAAGVCEELIFRGFLLTVLRVDLHQSLVVAVLVSSLAFGWAHLYQGFLGTLKTAFVGCVLAIVAVVSGGLLLPMLIHTLIDLQVLAMYRPEAVPALSTSVP